MPTLLSLPDEILDIIAGHLDATSLGNWASTDARLLSSATRCTKSLKVPSVTPLLLELVKQRVDTLRSLDLSNCNSLSASILTLIRRCRSVRELNVVNCKLQFTQLTLAVESLTELGTLSCCYLDKCQNLVERTRKLIVYAGSSSLRNIYIELPPSWPSVDRFSSFFSRCSALEKLHVNFIGTCSSSSSLAGMQWSLSREDWWQGLDTVIVSYSARSRAFAYAFLRWILQERFEREGIFRLRRSESSCFIYQKKDTDQSSAHTSDSAETNVRRDAYHVCFESHLAEQMSFPWGSPRGLKIDCRDPLMAQHAATYLVDPAAWSSDLVELDLTGCIPDLPGEADWSNLIESSPALQAIAIPFCFLPPQETAECSGNSCQPKRKRPPYSFFTLLTSIRLKKLFITGHCPHPPRDSLIATSLLGHHRPRNFSGINELAYLEELTLHNVAASASVFGSLANQNVRTVRLLLEDVANVSKMKEFIQKSVKLKHFKLETPSLALSSVLLWDALAEGISLEQICIGTQSRDSVDLSVIEDHLPRLFSRLRVLHVHADSAGNRNKLKATILRLVRQHKGESLDFVTKSATNPDEVVFPAFLPGRALCCVKNYVAKIKPVGWDLT